jgi:hypothetical protein
MARAEERRVGEPDELVREARVLHDHALELLEGRQIAARREHRQRAQAVGRRARAEQPRGLGEEAALEAVEAERAAVVVLRPRLDVLGEQRDPVAAQRGDRAGQRLAVELGDVELDDVGECQQRLGARRVAEVVQRDAEAVVDRVAESARPGCRRPSLASTRALTFVRRQRDRAHGQQELARDRHVGGRAPTSRSMPTSAKDWTSTLAVCPRGSMIGAEGERSSKPMTFSVRSRIGWRATTTGAAAVASARPKRAVEDMTAVSVKRRGR